MKVLMVVDDSCVIPDEKDHWRLTENHEKRIFASLRRLGHQPFVQPGQCGLQPLVERLDTLRPHVAFNLVEEYCDKREYDAMVADFLRAAGVRTTGNSGLCLRICRDKAISKSVLAAAAVPVPKYIAFRASHELDARALTGISYPVVVKPLGLDGSDLISRNSLCWSPRRAFLRAAWLLRKRRQAAIVEEYVEGRELCVPFAVFNRDVKFFPMRQLVVPRSYAKRPLATTAIKDRWFDRTVQPVFQASRLGRRDTETVCAVVREVIKALAINSYGRIDLVLTPAGIPVVLEANANSGLAPRGFGIYGKDWKKRYDALMALIVAGAYA